MSDSGSARSTAHERPADPRWGLCSACVHARQITPKRGTVYLLCGAPGLPKYPRTPVSQCDAFLAPRLT